MSRDTDEHRACQRQLLRGGPHLGHACRDGRRHRVDRLHRLVRPGDDRRPEGSIALAAAAAPPTRASSIRGSVALLRIALRYLLTPARRRGRERTLALLPPPQGRPMPNGRRGTASPRCCSGLLAVAALPVAGVLVALLGSVEVLPAAVVSVPAAFVLGLLGDLGLAPGALQGRPERRPEGRADGSASGASSSGRASTSRSSAGSRSASTALLRSAS